ncbi:MAG: CHAP domain-containing protein [Marmoricola sp.]
MTTSGRFVAYVVSVVLLGAVSVTTGAAPAEASVTKLCSGYTACARSGMSNAGYASANRTMYWRMYSGHNCTNYVAYRMIRSGLSPSRPWTGSGNATNWGHAMSRITDSTPAVGAVAWWRAGVKPAGSAGHVAYVEQVVSANEIIVSQDSWGGDFSWARVTRTSGGWPSGFIHFNDLRLQNTVKPAITGVAKVGSTLTASRGTWNPTTATLAYQWKANGVAIAGATRTTLKPTLAQVGKRITVQVTATQAGYPSVSALSAATAAVLPGALSNTVAPTITGDPRVGSTLEAASGTWNPAPDAIAYQWRAGGAVVGGATDSTLTVGPELVGKALSVTVTATKSGYAAVSRTTAPTAAVEPGTLELPETPAVTGDTEPGQTLTLQLPGVPPEAAVGVQWLRAGIVVPGATARTYRLGAADVGLRLSVRVRVTRPGYTPLTARTFSTPLVRAKPRLVVSAVPGVSRLAVSARVAATGVPALSGTLQVRTGGKVIRELPVRNGVARATLVGLPHGTRRYRFQVVATSTFQTALLDRRIRIG